MSEEMTDGEMFRCMRDAGRKEKRERLHSSTAVLVRLKVPFVSKNYGVHLVIADRWDFWPSTGKWFDRTRMKRGHDLASLLTSVGAVIPLRKP